MLGPVDPRYALYTKIRFRMLWTDQPSRREPHRKKCPRIANCFIGSHPGTCSVCTRGRCVFTNYTNTPGWRTFGIAAPITCAASDAYLSTPPFGVGLAR
ncbi:uncharacterized protein TNCV_1117341 [Trichonephila clavipes]|nr:uncharacterized protein TNCV_1117341 [Trichonephila clavipes]